MTKQKISYTLDTNDKTSLKICKEISNEARNRSDGNVSMRLRCSTTGNKERN